METYPERVTASWIATLADGPLMTAELHLHTAFIAEEKTEKLRRGSRYALLEGPATLVNAWLRWTMVSNEARIRGIVVRHTS